MKKVLALFLIMILLLSSCTMGDFCKISDVNLRIFNNVTEVTVDEGDDAFFYTKKPLTDVCVYKMEWEYESESYKEIQTVVKDLTLTKGDALRIFFDGTADMPYVRITFTYKDGKTGERFIFRDKNDKLWVLNQQI